VKSKIRSAGPVAAGLLVLTAAGAAAQGGIPAYAEGTIAVDGEACTDHGEWNECPLVLESAEARLSGEGVTRNHGMPMPMTGDQDGLVIPVTQTIRVETADGAWTGGGTLYAVPREEPVIGQDELTWILTGSGAYEGLTAVLQVDFGSSFAGVIFEGEVPSAPPAPEG